MNRIQKISWVVVICFAVAMSISLVAVGVLWGVFGMPKALLGFCFMGLFGISGLAQLFIRKDKGEIAADERDRAIHMKSSWAGFGASYLVMGAACMIPFFVLGPEYMVRVAVLPNVFMVGGLTFYLVYSVTILVQYGKGGESNE